MSEQASYIFEVSESNFETVVVQNSQQLPVFVEFLGVWSEHCALLEERLVRLAREFAGQFIFAKVDIEEQQGLRKLYAVENVPTLKVFKDGIEQISVQGVVEEQELRLMLKSYDIFRESDELRELARDKHLQGQTIEAITLLTQAIQKDPGNTRVAMDMVQVFIDIGELSQAESLFQRLPESDRDSDAGRGLLGQLTFKKLAAKTEGREVLAMRLAENVKDYDAHFDMAVCLVAVHDYQQAMEHLFTILQEQADYKEGAAREMIVSLTNMLTTNEPELAQQFRRRLASVLS